MDAPEARYLERDGALLAYQVVGNGAADVLWVGEAAQHWDLAWTDPDIHALYERSAAWSRTVQMQMRGLGLSEAISYLPTFEEQADDVLAVLDAAGMQRATLVGSLTTCGAITVAAAKAPERVSGIVLFKPIPCGPLHPNALEHGWTAEAAAEYAAGWRAAVAAWGTGSSFDMWDPMCATPYNRRLIGLLERCSSTPAYARMYVENALGLDYTSFLPLVQAPTRVLYPPTGKEPVAVTRRAAELIPNATFHTLEPTPRGASVGEAYQQVWLHLQEAATGVRQQSGSDRFLGTVLFTDIVGSTELLARVGDARYRELRDAHEREVRLQVELDGGRLLNVTGDGTLSLFDGPTKAVRCAAAICRSARDAGVDVRAGVHTGELERTSHDVTGLSVHIGARVSALAGPGEVFVSSTVRELVAGSGLEFAERGSRVLKGVPGTWTVYALAGVAERPAPFATDTSLETALDRATLRTARAAPWAMRAAMRAGNAVQRYRARARTSDLAQ